MSMSIRKLVILLSLTWIPSGQSRTILEYILEFDYKPYLKIENLLGVNYGHHEGSSDDVPSLPDFDSESESKDDSGPESSSGDMATLGPDDKRPPDLTDAFPDDFTDAPIGVMDPITDPHVKGTEPPEGLTDPPVAPPTKAPTTALPTASSTIELTEEPIAPEEQTETPTVSPTKDLTEEPTAPEKLTEAPTKEPTEETTEKVLTGVPTALDSATGTSTGSVTSSSTIIPVSTVEEEVLEIPADSSDVFTDISLEVLSNLDTGSSTYPTLNDEEKQELATSISQMINDEVLATTTQTGSELGKQIFEAVVTKISEYFNSVAEPLTLATGEEIEAAAKSIAQTVLELVRLILESDVEGPPDLQAYQKIMVEEATDQIAAYAEENKVTLPTLDTSRISIIAEQVLSQMEKGAGDEVITEEYLVANADKIAQLIANDYLQVVLREKGEPVDLSQESLADITSTITDITISIALGAAGN